MEAFIGIADRARGRVVESQQCPIDLDAVPSGLHIETSQEGLRRELAADALVCRGFRREIDSAFAARDEPCRRTDILAQSRLRPAGPTDAGRRTAAPGFPGYIHNTRGE